MSEEMLCEIRSNHINFPNPEAGQIWRHYKGSFYIVRCVARREADRELLVIYQGEDGAVWCRPKYEWFEIVEHDQKLGVPRYKLEGHRDQIEKMTFTRED